MNERIKELAKEAGLKVNADGEISPAFFGSVDAGYRKFAELIVRECAGQCLSDDCMRILNHFGVEA